MSEAFSKIIIERLRNHLVISKIAHDVGIMAEPSLKHAHVYSVLNGLSAQIYGPMIDKYIRIKFGYSKNSASDCNGDACKASENYEIKASLGGSQHRKFNYVQIRFAQDVQFYLLTAYYLDADNVDSGGDLYIFKLSKDVMKLIVLQCGGYAHGTKKEHGPITQEDLNNARNMKEYAIRPTFGDTCWKLLLPYRITEAEL
jgi:hypothetical protein